MSANHYPSGHPNGHPSGNTEHLLDVLHAIDLTSLDASDNEASTIALARKGMFPAANLKPAGAVCVLPDAVGQVAAVCVLPHLVGTLATVLDGTGVKAACVAGDFPTVAAPRSVRIAEIAAAADAGADEIDIVLNRQLFVSGYRDGNFADVRSLAGELQDARRACGDAKLKVILETGEMGSDWEIRRASRLLLSAGADFLKTSTGKTPVGATPEAVRSMAAEIRAYYEKCGRRIGIKVSGGVRSVDDALAYRAIVADELGEDWLVPSLFRIGASGLVDTLVAELF